MTLKEELAVALDEAVKPVKPVAPVGGKKGANTPIEDCKAKNPMLCPYHGAGKIAEFLNSKSTTGLKFMVEKKGNGKYAISCTYTQGNYEAWTDAENCIKALQKVNGFQGLGTNKDGPSDDVDNLTKFSNELSMSPDDAIGGLSEDVDKLDKDIFGADDLDPEAAEAISDVELALEQPEDELDYDTLNDLYKKAKILHAYKGDMDAVMEKGMEALAIDQQLPVDELQSDLMEMLENAKGAFPDGVIPDKFPGIHSLKDAKLALNGVQNQLVGAQENFMEATEFGDLYVAKEALSLLDDAANKYKDAYDLYKKHVDAMSENFGKCYGESDWTKVPLTYPEELLTNPGDKAENVPGQQSEQTPNKESLLNLWLVTHGNYLLNNHGLKATKANKAALAEEMKQLLDEGKLNPHFNSNGIIAASISNGDVTDSDLLADFFEHMKSDKPKTAKSKKTDEPITEVPQKDLPTEMLKPLEHDESKFPQFNSEKELLAAIKSSVSAGGGGGLGTKIVTMKDGTKFVMKKGTGDEKEAIVNGFNCDMAYRAGGIHSPDAKLYEFGGKVYKLAEFIEGTRLDKMVTKDSKTGAWNVPQAVRDEMLKGYPLDCLFSNWDVLGTNEGGGLRYTNIIVDKDGHCWRLDNDGAFAASGLVGGQKSTDGKLKAIRPVEYEKWDSWEDRQWIDDFRTMRVEKMNQGVFDGYSTADIFRSAGRINLDHAVKSLPDNLQKALAKPLHETKQMAYRAVNIEIGGFKNDLFASMALDASYEASKRGLREVCQKKVSWNNSGFGEYKDSWSKYQKKPFEVPEPVAPENPMDKMEKTLDNDAYTGSQIANTILKAIKTIHNHAGFKITDEGGKVLGNGTAMENPDYKPNASTMAAFDQIDREKLEELSKTDESAKTLLGFYDAVVYSKQNGYTKPIGAMPENLSIKKKLPQGFMSSEEKKLHDDMAGAMAEFEKAKTKYEADHKAWNAKKIAHNQAEDKKAAASGGFAYHNFHDFANAFITEGISTDGISNSITTAGIEPIEDSMESQKGSSYATDAVKWKVREMMALGYSADDIKKMAEEGKLYNGSSYTHCLSSYSKKKAQWDKEMASHAIYRGLNMLKMENETNDQYDKENGVIYLNRNISSTPNGITEAEKKVYNGSGTGFIGPHIDSAADCMQFEKNTWSASKKQVYAVPISRVVCCANNLKATGGQYGFHSENEYVGNLYMLPCYVYHGSGTTWLNAIKGAKENEGMKAWLAKCAKRLNPFNTLLKKKK